MKKRADELLLQKNLAKDLNEARSLILAGRVLLSDEKVKFAGQLSDEHVDITVRCLSRFVSRGGDKLWGFVDDLDLKGLFQNATVVDVGSSTGGFTDCALQLGAKTVWAVDVGSNQLAWNLRQNPRVVVKEKTHIADFTAPNEVVFDLVLADISFHSLRALLPSFLKIPTHQESSFLLLVKPQFELPKEEVPSGGIIEDQEKAEDVLKSVIRVFVEAGFEYKGSMPSRIRGQKGNQEFFIHLTRGCAIKKPSI